MLVINVGCWYWFGVFNWCVDRFDFRSCCFGIVFGL